MLLEIVILASMNSAGTAASRRHFQLDAIKKRIFGQLMLRHNQRVGKTIIPGPNVVSIMKRFFNSKKTGGFTGILRKNSEWSLEERIPWVPMIFN